MLLRRYHNKNQKIEGIEEEKTKTNLIQDIEEAYELAIKENKIRSLEKLKVDALRELAKEKEIEGYSKMKKEDLIQSLVGE